MKLQYRGKYHKALWSTITFKNQDKLNIIADAMKNHLDMRYTTHLIKFNLHHKGFNSMCKSTANLVFLRPKRKKYRELNKVQIMRESGNK